jgi:peroxiredoxin
MRWRGANPEIEAGHFPTLQARLDDISAKTRELVPAEKLAIYDRARQEICASGVAARALRAGDRAPEFELPDAEGRLVGSAGLLARGPLVLVFFRGRWCPYCTQQLAAMQQVEPEFEAAGASLLAISPQSVKHTYLTRDQHHLKNVLSDAGNAVARRFGLVYRVPDYLKEMYLRTFVNLKVYNGDEAWELPVPATYIVAPGGAIAWAAVEGDHTRRPEPAEVLQRLRQMAPAV